jgi:hypothetical protein
MSEQKPAIQSATISGAAIALISGFVLSQGWFPEDANAPLNQVITSFVELVAASGGLLFVYGARKAKGDIKGGIKGVVK